MPKVTEVHSAARHQIIDAAYRCFARKGFHQATMRDIYAEANLSPGAVYHYFDSKDAIIQACRSTSRRDVRACPPDLFSA